jgi:hypothetical protein
VLALDQSRFPALVAYIEPPIPSFLAVERNF